MSAIRMLARVPLFSTLSEEQLDSLVRHLRQRVFRAGEAIFHKDDPGQTLYIIHSGRVKIHNVREDGNETIIAILPTGEFFGELSLLDGKGRSADATAIEPTELLMLHREDFLRCLQQSAKMVSHILTVLGTRLREADAQLYSITSLNVNGRLARQLMLLARQHGVQTAKGIQIPIRLTQQNLASQIGATRESVNKAMTYFRENNYLLVERTYYITIADPNALMQFYAP